MPVKPNKTIKRNNSDINSERFLNRLSNYLIVVIAIVIIGLLNTKGSMRGFPIPWLSISGSIKTAELLGSLILTAIAVIGSDFLALIYIASKEPKLKVNTREPRLSERDQYAETIEMSEMMPAKLKQPQVSANVLKKFPELSGDNKKKKSGISAFVVGLIILVIGMTASAIGGLTDDSYDDYYYDDVNIEADSDEYTTTQGIEEAIYNADSQLFDALEYKDYGHLEDICDEDEFENIAEFEKITEMTEWNSTNYSLIHALTDDEDSYAVCKYLAEDYSDNKYIVAVLMDMQNDDGGVNCIIRGVSVCPVTSAYEDLDYYSNEDIKSIYNDTKDKIVSIGVTEINGSHILIFAD